MQPRGPGAGRTGATRGAASAGAQLDHDVEPAIAAALARLKPAEGEGRGWERSLAARVMSRVEREIERRVESPSLWQLIARWPAPLVPAAAAAAALALVLSTEIGWLASPATDRGATIYAEVPAVLSGDPLAHLVSDPVLTLIGTGSSVAEGERTP